MLLPTGNKKLKKQTISKKTPYTFRLIVHGNTKKSPPEKGGTFVIKPYF